MRWNSRLWACMAVVMASSAGADPGDPRPFKGECDTTFQITGPLAAPLVGFTLHLTGVCHHAHLGRTTLDADQTVVMNNDGTETVTNVGTLTAANGDELYSRFTGVGTAILQEGVPIGVRLTGSEQYEDGTGRFADAAGSSELDGAAFFDPPSQPGAPPTTGSGHYTVSGTISRAPPPGIRAPEIQVTDSVSPAGDLNVDFGNVSVGSSGTATVTATNTGTAPLVLGTSATTPPFVVAADGCSGKTVAAGESCTIDLEFAPVVAGSATGTLTIPSNDADERVVGVSLTGTGVPVDGCTQVIGTMLANLAAYINAEIANLQDLLPRNPGIATQIQAKITMLQTPGLADAIITGQYYTCSNVRSSDGRWLPIAAVYPVLEMGSEAAELVGTIELALPILEDFLVVPFPYDDQRVWYGFTIGNRAGGGQMHMEDETSYELRTPPTRLPYEAIVDHELSHSYIGHESLNQFLELYVYNLVHTASSDVADWVFVRNYVPFDTSNTGVHALLDVYQLIGLDGMKRAYRAVYPLHPPYGVPLTDAIRQVFVDASPLEVKAEVGALMANVTY